MYNIYTYIIYLFIYFCLNYNYRSLLSRNAKGRVCAGLYFPVGNCSGSDAQLTLFYNGANDQSVKVKQKFNIFKDETKVI